MSITPCGDHTQLCSGRLGTFRYVPPATSTSHSTREKLIRHWSPFRGGTVHVASSFKLFHGQRISTVQPRSVSAGLLIVPSTWTAVFKPVISHASTARPPSL